MLKVNKLKIQNLGRFVGSHEIDFQKKSNFIQVDAENNNTGGSSGSGKSSIFLALEYVLGINDSPSTVLQSRLTKDPLCVELEICKNDKVYKVSRHRSEGLSIVGPDIEISGNTKEAEAVLDRLLEIPRGLLKPMIHKSQGAGGFFLSKTPKQSHDFLMECLNMEAFESKTQKIQSRLKKIEEDLSFKNNELSLTSASVSTTEDLLKSLAPPKCDVDEQVLDTLHKKINVLKQEKDRVTQEMSEKLSGLSDIPKFSYHESVKISFSISSKEGKVYGLSQRIIDYVRDISVVEETLRTDKGHAEITRQAMERRPAIQQELLSLKNDITEAIKKKCPTCKQGLETEQFSHEIAAPLIEKAQKKKAEIEAIDTMEAKLPLVLNGIEINTKLLSELQETKAKAEEDLKVVKAELAEAVKARDEAKNKAMTDYQQIVELAQKEKESVINTYYPLIEENDSKLALYNEAYYKGQASLKSYNESLERHAKQKELTEKQLSKTKEKIASLNEEIALLKKEFSLCQDSLKLIKSYTNQLFQESLAIVADTATKIVSRIPNMSTATITFDAYKETKSGALKEEVVAILSLDGEVDVPVKSMSGGERASIDLAVDLAVVDMIESKTGNGLDLFILDEPFDGLDAVCRENCLEVLKSHTSNRKILIVDHSTETKQMVQDKILVVRDGQFSKINSAV